MDRCNHHNDGKDDAFGLCKSGQWQGTKELIESRWMNEL